MTTDNKTIVVDALSGVVKTGNVDALASALHDDFIHHRPDGTSTTKTEWLAAVTAVPLRDLDVEILHILGESDTVAVYSHRRLGTGGPTIAVVEIWRFERGLITEGWEIIEPVDEAGAHALWWRAAAH
ncbi:hypothetical protein BAY61_12785 [Prauserella marina]|uniref:Predicted SnoaL-like aldol condensation-catalyzing enzyme n=1 Tax=Prauserella marina TaxID=530584 RepID=A0A222VPF5_9PSEU|nr:nuclear transport factor 2 family protein [Prauserella marina]ASR35732.1 hypothetical protein BAY61_12785 [Prauserella marina]PWV84382.1 putative SnoaL-like aldol condensation-catalyzing enzyme [Prauserella marina]SDC23981.1 Predicted SnoaL-like aldol condensation-catalyzing enzyme [Prauserella marina]